jgi:hypothetical protein
MFDVMLIRFDPGFLPSTKKEKSNIAINYETTYGKYEKYARRGFVPVWNINKLKLKSEDFPLATLDKINYEYVFDLVEEGTEHGYLADYGNADISSVRREGNTLIVTSPTQKGLYWDMYKVTKRKEYITDSFPYDLMNNGQEESFAARMIAHYGTVIKSNAELRRLLAAYDVSKYIEFDSVEVTHGEINGETYQVNNFLKDEIRDLVINKSLLIRFKPLKRNSYIIRDVMSFLVSQAQIIYPEFNCVGVLV